MDLIEIKPAAARARKLAFDAEKGMKYIVILGAGIGGMSCAYELRAALGAEHKITVINELPKFSFTPSNPWVAIGWRKPAVQFDVPRHFRSRRLRRHSAGGKDPRSDVMKALGILRLKQTHRLSTTKDSS